MGVRRRVNEGLQEKRTIGELNARIDGVEYAEFNSSADGGLRERNSHS